MYAARKPVLENREIPLILKGKMSFATETRLATQPFYATGTHEFTIQRLFPKACAEPSGTHSCRFLRSIQTRRNARNLPADTHIHHNIQHPAAHDDNELGLRRRISAPFEKVA